jgi:hypothetical protein
MLVQNVLHPGVQSTCPRRCRTSSAPRPRWARTPRPANVCWSMRNGTLPRRTAIPTLSPCPTRRARIDRSHRPHRLPTGVAAVLRLCAPPCCAHAVTGLARTAFNSPAYKKSRSSPASRNASVSRAAAGRHLRPHGELSLSARTIAPRALPSFLLHHLSIPGLLVSPPELQPRRRPSSSGACRPAPPAFPSGRLPAQF